MGMYGEVDIIATFETTEQADRVEENLELNVIKHIKKKLGEKPFDLHLIEIDLDDTSFNIKICSDRHQNAEWGGEQLFEYLLTQEGLIDFTAEIMTPQNFISWSADE